MLGYRRANRISGGVTSNHTDMNGCCHCKLLRPAQLSLGWRLVYLKKKPPLEATAFERMFYRFNQDACVYRWVLGSYIFTELWFSSYCTAMFHLMFLALVSREVWLVHGSVQVSRSGWSCQVKLLVHSLTSTKANSRQFQGIQYCFGELSLL